MIGSAKTEHKCAFSISIYYLFTKCSSLESFSSHAKKSVEVTALYKVAERLVYTVIGKIYYRHEMIAPLMQ